MFRRPGDHPFSVVALIAVLWLGGAVFADELGVYLERHGLPDLLALHLEDQLAVAEAEERTELLHRLASIYAQLLATTDVPARREVIERRSRELLRSAPGSVGDELRLALLRGSYRSAEMIAENHRLRLEGNGNADDARRLLTEIIPQLAQLRDSMVEHVERFDRRLSRASGSQAVSLQEELRRAERLQRQCVFLYAWALYYQSYLHDRPDNARAAEPLFADLLGTESSYPEPGEISVDLRESEAFARAILGMALCKSLSASHSMALNWLALLEHPRAFDALRAEAPAWRLVVLLQQERFAEAREVLGEAVDERPAPVAWCRLAIIEGLERGGNDREARALVRTAVAELAARSELRQLLELSSRYGVETLGGSGFVFRYLKGVLQYEEARIAHGDEEPTADTELIALYEQAKRELVAAKAEDDAGEYPAARAACLSLIGWCYYFQQDFSDAHDAFTEAIKLTTGETFEEALWMAIVCLDRVLTAREDPESRNELNALIDRFLAAFPHGDRAARLIYKRVVSAGEATPERVDELLAIQPDSEVYDAAQRKAAHILYTLFRESKGADRVAYGNDYLSVAVGLLAMDERRLDDHDPLQIQELMARCRRVLEVSLSPGVDRLVAAAGALRTIDDLLALPGFDSSGVQAEIDYRRVQERLAVDDWSAASVIADELWRGDPSVEWAQLAQRALFRFALRRNDGTQTRQEQRDTINLLARYGQRVLMEYDESPAALDDPRVMPVYAEAAHALRQRFERSNLNEDGLEALTLYRRLLSMRPTNATFLHATAVLAERFGEDEEALECWRRLGAGREIGTEGWYEARFHFISLLAAIDPQRARMVMDQHRQLHPDYGPEPWRSRLRALDLRLPLPVEPEEARRPEGDQ